MNAVVLRKRTLSTLTTIALAASALALAGCGGGDDETAAAVAPPPGGGGGGGGGGANNAPTISGTPAGSVLANSAYSFTPTASDADGNTLTFSIQNRPQWASFNTTTGALTGTPTTVGTHPNITISVSDGTATVALAQFTIQVVGTATGSAMLTWNPPTTNTDGSALSNLSGYKIYWGTSQGSYPNSATITNPGISSYVVEQLTPATWYFVLTAVNGNGIESSFSNTASKQVL